MYTVILFTEIFILYQLLWSDLPLLRWIAGILFVAIVLLQYAVARAVLVGVG